MHGGGDSGRGGIVDEGGEGAEDGGEAGRIGDQALLGGCKAAVGLIGSGR